LKESIEGEIVTSAVKPIGDTGLFEGIITVKRPDGELVRIEVSSYTSFTTLEEGDVVKVDVEHYTATQSLYATNVVALKKSVMN
jgi:hypothetical protein